MRLRRLVLARYGKFTDQVLDLGEVVEGMPDLHIVHGPNEAGKSTLFSGFLDLLFGIEQQSRYGFLHPYETMRVGGVLELSAGPRELVRIKKPQPTLRDADDQPVPQGLLAGELGGLDRAAYRTMFSLDDETLESGGESILASNGELGQLLFSASAGLAELSRILLDIRAVTDGFTWPGARSGELHKLKAELAALKTERDRADTQAGTYAQLARARDEADKAYREAAEDVSTRKRDLARIRSLRTALPRMTAWRGIQAKLAAFGDLPAVPASWQADLPDLERAEPGHRSATEQAVAEVARLTRALDETSVDEAALAWSGRLDALDTLLARNTTAALDLPARRADLAGADAAVAGILARLGRAGEPDPGMLLLTAAQEAAFDELLAQRSGIEAKVATAQDELVEASDDLAAAQRALGPSPQPIAAAHTRIGACLTAWRASDHPVRLKAAGKQRTRLEEALAPQLAALLPWCGDAPSLAALTVPDAGMIQSLQEAAKERAAPVTRWQGEVERLEGALGRQKAELAAMCSVAGLFSDQQAGEVRSAREAAWARHRQGLEATTADAFETALRQDDLAGAARLRHERDLAKLHETERVVQVGEAELADARKRLAEALEAERHQAGFAAEAVAGVDPALADMTLAAFPTWTARRTNAVATWQALHAAEQELLEGRADEETLRADLRDALSLAAVAFDPAASAVALAVAAQDAMEREGRLDHLRNAVADCEKNLGKRERAVAKAASAEEAWRGAWLAACSGCWLGPVAATAPFSATKATVAATSELGPALDKRSGLARRIQDMESDQAAFGAEVDRLAAELSMEANGRSKPDLATAIKDRVQEAARADREREANREKLATAQEKARKAQLAAQTHAGRVKEMMGVLDAGSLIEVAGKLRDIADRARLRMEAATAEQEVKNALEVGTLAEAEPLLEGRFVAALESEEAALASPLEDIEQHARKSFAWRQAAIERIEAVGGDDAAARVEERRRTLLLEVEDKARHFLHLRLGIVAAERALRVYRNQHCSSMMKQASDAFGLISRGAYRGLGTQPGKDGDILVAIGANGGSKLAADLSKGTRFQLYLALRAAGYREFAKLRPAVPFIADDIMETFDDLRAEETLKVLGEMSRLGQVIYLTHHGHLREIAERAVPGTRLHELSP